MKVKRMCIFLSYMGQCYSGSQFQPPPLQTIQHSVLETLRQTWNWPEHANPRSSVVSRTDAGVHALKNILLVEIHEKKKFQSEKLRERLNGLLKKNGDGVCVTDIKILNDDVNPRKTLEKTYIYKLCVNTSKQNIPPSVFHHLVTHISPDEFDEEKFRKAGELLSGEHDFSRFTSLQVDSNIEYILRKVCREVNIDIQTEPLNFPLTYLYNDEGSRISQGVRSYNVILKGTGFMYKQIRYMVGAMVDVATGKMTIEHLKNRLDSPERYKREPVFVAGPNGLFLVDIKYPDNSFVDENLKGTVNESTN